MGTGSLLVTSTKGFRIATASSNRGVGRFVGPWRHACAAVGRPSMLLHDFRRSGARTLIRAGVPEDVVMRLGGWKTRSMLTRYNIVDVNDLVDAQAKLDQALAAPAKVVPIRKVVG